MKFKLTIEAIYEIADDRVAEAYGTTDPAECARIDHEAGQTMLLLDMAVGPVTHKVEPVRTKET